MAHSEDVCIHELFEDQVARTPEAVAATFGEEQLTYRELNGRANQLARALQHLGVGPDVLVGLCVERSIPMLVGVLGILKAGGAYVPLDPTYPKDRLAFMLQDTRARLLLTQRALAESLPDFRGSVFCLDADWPRIVCERDDDPFSGATPDNLALVIYTSGSTGMPKGVSVVHRGPVNRFFWMWHCLPYEPGERSCQKTTLGFIDSVWEIFAPLLRGVPLVIISDAVVRDVPQFIDELGESAVTRIVLVPSLLQTMLRAYPDLDRRLPDLKYWTTSGEALSVDLCRDFLGRLPGRRLINMYGSSESSGHATWYDVSTEPLRPFVPLGRPIANTEIHILDRHLQPAPIGVEGELCVSAAGLARGYLNQPELTAEKFLADPLGGIPGQRLYRTGDLARWHEDGTLEFLGRVDQQVKIRGFRVELGEIETALRQHQHVEEAVVVARDDGHSDKRLVAYVAPRSGEDLEIDELRQWLQGRLPHYTLPSAIVALASLPRTPSGKLDRLALAEPTALLAGNDGYVAPRTEAEAQLARIWQELLGLETVGVSDSFFDLGGDSLLAVHLVLRIENVLGVRVPVALIYQERTIEQLALAIDRNRSSVPWSLVVPLQSSGTHTPLFCIHALDGDVTNYLRLSHHLGLDQPVYAIRAQGMDGLQAPETEWERMAATYVEAIRTIQPSGPYYLAGFSSGGTAAYEIACQFVQAGESVGLVALIDHAADKDVCHRPAFTLVYIENFLCNLVGSLAFWIHQPKREQLGDVVGFVNKVRIWGCTVKRSATTATPDGVQAAEVARIAELIAGDPTLLSAAQRGVLAAQFESWKRYRAKRYPGRVTLLRARRQPFFCSHSAAMGWEGLARGGVEVRRVPGRHGSIMHEPYVRSVAAHLRDCLRNAGY